MKWKLISILFFNLVFFNPIYSQNKDVPVANPGKDTSTVNTYSVSNLVSCKECAIQAKELVKYPASAIENNITGTIDALLIIDKNGRVNEVKLFNKLGYGCDEEVIRVSKLLTGFVVDDMQEGTVSTYTISFKFVKEIGKYKIDVINKDVSLNDGQLQHRKKTVYNQSFSRDIEENKNEMIKYTSPAVVIQYIITQMNYELVELERFADYKNITLKFTKFNSRDVEIIILLHNFKSYVTNKYEIKGTLKFPLIPLDIDVTVIAIKDSNGQPFFYMESFKTKENRKIEINYKRMTYKELNNKIKNLSGK